MVVFLSRSVKTLTSNPRAAPARNARSPMLVLASTSAYRRELLARLRLPFEVAAPHVDEAPRAGELPAQTALRLAQEKARAVAARFAQALVIGSDQVAEVDGERLDKPGSHERARAQLQLLSGRAAVFHTAVALLNSSTGRIQARVVTTRVRFRRLDPAQIESYLLAERPYDCAGAAKSEGLGIALIEAIEGDDPTALIGLPLIALTAMLSAEGHPIV
jgi:septum formation protein